MKKENRISYRAGITRSPSDFLCEDGELAECINLVTDNEELKTVVDPAEKFSFQDLDQESLVFTHRLPSGDTNYITHDGDGRHLCYFQDGESQTTYFGSTTSNKVSLQAIGNTLIVCDDSGLFYYLWKGDQYVAIGNKIPEPIVKFYLVNGYQESVEHDVQYSTVEAEGDIASGIIDQSTHTVLDQGKFNDLVFGLYAEADKKAKRRNLFSRPFFIRYALRLVDGEYIYHSQPILVLPSMSSNADFIFLIGDRLTCRIHTGQLHYESLQDYSDWTDIVSGVDVFVTDQVPLYDTGQDAVLDYQAHNTTVWNGIGAIISHNVIDEHSYAIQNRDYKIIDNYDIGDIEEQLISSSVFYKLAKIGIHSTDGHEILKIPPHVLENITTQTFLSTDDFYSHSAYTAQYMKTYNQRLHLANIKRSFFEGFNSFILYDNNSNHTWTAVVHIDTNEGEKIVETTPFTTKERMLHFFYYPDPRATSVDLYDIGPHYKYTIPLKEHPGLNGAYFFSMPPVTITDDYTVDDDPQYTSPDPESLMNTIIVSEVNNPFVFKAEGYIHIGMGNVIGIATQTMALGQEEHGIHPLTVFTDRGICSLRVNNEGVYMSADEVSREVCINAESITETDGQVFFVSKKGLMFIAGRDVRCVSGQMNGMPFDTADLSELDDLPSPASPWEGVITPCQGSSTFLEFIRDSRLRIAYDYTDSRLLLINPAYGFAYAYGMADGSISKVILPGSVTNVVSDYPDYLLQAGDKVYTLYGKPREDEITARKTAFMLTRPMKLAGPLTVTSLRELVNVGMWDRDGGSMVKTVVWVSDDLHSWYVRSSRFGAAARYYRIGLFIKMKPTERLSGTIVMQQERRTDNKRA